MPLTDHDVERLYHDGRMEMPAGYKLVRSDEAGGVTWGWICQDRDTGRGVCMRHFANPDAAMAAAWKHRATLAPPDNPEDAIAKIQRAVARAYGLTRRELLERKRPALRSEARHVAMWLARRFTVASYPAIARAFRRDHSTVIHAVNKIQRRPPRQLAAIRERVRLALMGGRE